MARKQADLAVREVLKEFAPGIIIENRPQRLHPMSRVPGAFPITARRGKLPGKFRYSDSEVDTRQAYCVATNASFGYMRGIWRVPTEAV